jgi:LmbE family N-acetylglucosaminyl deacetylase
MRNFFTKFRITLVALVCLPASYAQRDLSGAAEISLGLKKLNVLGTVLMIAAHPDDENTAVLAYFARGRHMRTAYLSATRGEGGQNLIGPEQGDLLGVIRTQELLAARHIDGAEQFFTRAIDFGFSKSAAEALEKWGEQKILSDMVWVIRRYRPDVIILRFSGTPRDGHGQHQASAILGKQAFFAAADPSRFPEQLTEVKPWKAKRLLFNVISFTAEQEKAAAQLPGRLVIDTGEFDPVLGKSYMEIAGASRSMHRSQAMGAPERKGSSKQYFVLVAGEPAHQDVFDGIDTTWSRLPGGEPVGRILSDAIRGFIPEHPDKTIPSLLRARALSFQIKDPLAERKLNELHEAVALCSGLWLDAVADRFAVTPGGTLNIDRLAVNRSPFPLELIGSKPAPLAYNAPHHAKETSMIPASHGYSQPFWLMKLHSENIYSIDRQDWIGLADSPPVLEESFRLRTGDAEISLTRPVEYRYVDRAQGELTRPLIVVPPVAVNLPEQVLMFPDEGVRKIAIQVKANVPKMSGRLRLELDRGWRAQPVSQPFELADAGEQQELAFEIQPPPTETTAQLRALASVAGTEIASGMKVIAYPHIPPQTVFPPSTAKLVRASVKVLAKNIGYVMGAGDDIPDSLRQIGCAVTLLAPEDLARGDLAAFDAIVTGVRAYNVRSDLRANQDRLLAYVHNGGTMIVQYNVAEGGGPFGERDTGALSRIGPFPLKVGRERVTVEEAPVTFPNPELPLLKQPNLISQRDFEGWVQERGLYFASEWDPRYQPVLESHDPGEKPLPGGTLYTRYGKGVYIFTAYSWFRQLPAGVPGAFRIFANLLSAGKAPK